MCFIVLQSSNNLNSLLQKPYEMSDEVAAKPSEGISIVPVSTTDVSSLVRVHTAAFKLDLFSILMVANREENAHQNHMRKSIEFWMSDPDSQLVQAVDADGEIVGWSCWVLKGADKTVPAAAKSSSSPKPTLDVVPSTSVKAQEAAEGGPTAGPEASAMPQAPEPKTSQDTSRVLGGRMYEDMVQWEAEHTKGREYLVLQALATDPRFQRRGIGTKLLQWGIDKADAGDLPCWTHASPASYTLYERVGFQEVGKSDYDLDEYAPGGRGGNRGWGRYTFRYMLRPSRGSV